MTTPGPSVPAAPPPPVKPWSYVLIAAGLTLVPALTFAVSADLPHILLFTLLGCLVAGAVRRPMAYSDRSVIYSLVLAITAAALFDLVFPMRDNRLGYISIFFYPNIMVPFLLYLAVAVSMFEPSPRALGIVAACSLTCLMFGGDVFNTDTVGERLPFAAPLVRHIYYFYGVMVALELAVLLAGLFWSLGRGSSAAVAARLLRRRRILKFCCVALAPLLAVAMLVLYVKNESAIRAFENYLLRFGVRRLMPGPGRVKFDKQVDLNFTMSPELVRNQGQIVMRVRSAAAPGYLRAKAYRLYRDGIWKEEPAPGPAVQNKKYDGLLAYTTFYFGDSPDRGRFRYDIFPASRFAAEILAVPGNTVRVDIIADQLTAGLDGAIEVKEWVRDGGYSCYTLAADPESAWPQPVPPDLPGYLELPGNAALHAVLDRVRRRISGGKTDLSDREFALRTVNFFRENFQYSLDWSFDGQGDPIAYFLEKHRRAHCELFASATALLLRRQGIPCRYVTGFVCDERHPSGRYYVSRLGNAHAWVEAWDRQQRRWSVVESTPASGIPNFRHQWGSFEPWRDRATQMFQEMMALLRRGVVATAIVAVFAALGSFLADLLFNPWRAAIILLLAAALLRWWWKRRQRRRRREGGPDPERRELQRAYLRLEKRLEKHCAVARREGETVDEFLARAAASAPLPETLRELLEEYRRMRYSPTPPDPEKRRSWARRALLSRRDWRKR